MRPDRGRAAHFAPGGTDGTLAAMRDAEALASLSDAARAVRVTSVSPDALMLGASGLTEGHRATSHWAAHDVPTAFGAVPTAPRVMRDRNRAMGAGATAGIDLGLSRPAEPRGADDVEIARARLRMRSPAARRGGLAWTAPPRRDAAGAGPA